MRACVEVLDPGLFTLVEDLGRPGLAHLGVGRSGAADRPSLCLANMLVGNLPSAAALELTLGAATFRFHSATTIAVTGAPAAVTVDARRVEANTPIAVHPGDTVHIGRPRVGVRTYLAVRGGIDVPPVLGSRSRDTLADLGPPPLRRGDLLPIGGDSCGPPRTGPAPVPAIPTDIVLRVHPGPRDDWFPPEAMDTLLHEDYQVTPMSNRVGIRLRGAPLRHRATRELPPEGTVTGAIQIPPDGQPVIFLADHPVTGGYPVIAVITTADHTLAAQTRPGQRIRFAAAASSGSRASAGQGVARSEIDDQEYQQRFNVLRDVLRGHRPG